MGDSRILNQVRGWPLRATAVVSAAILMTGCSGGSGPSAGDGITAGGSAPGTGEPVSTPPPSEAGVGYLNLSVSDAPIKDAAKVCIRFDGVELKHADSGDKESIDFDQPEVVNLLANQGANSQPIVTLAELPAGAYEWIRLKVQAERGLGGGANDSDPTSKLCDDATENSYLVSQSGGVHNLYIPSGATRGLQLIKDIIIPVNRSGDYTAEWDLGKSFNGPPGLKPDVMMKPVVKVVANNEVGTLVGQVDDELITLESCDADFAPSVYVFDDGVEPNSLDDPFAEDDAIATGLVEQQPMEDGSMPWRYSIGFLLAGDYEAAYTCNGTDFIPLAGKPATIVVNEVTTVDFFADDASVPVGSLGGTVVSNLIEACAAESEPAVYVFGDSVADEEPVATGPVAENTETELFEYLIENIEVGTYTAAFSCDGTEFIPVNGAEAVIESDELTRLDFSPEPTP